MWERLGGIDLLVNNAGIGMRTVNPRFLSDPQPFWEVPPDGFRDVLETKVTGCFLMARAVVPLMLEQGGGRIVIRVQPEAGNAMLALGNYLRAAFDAEEVARGNPENGRRLFRAKRLR